jgi:hypothetical protein
VGDPAAVTGGKLISHHRTHVKTRSGRRQTSAAAALHLRPCPRGSMCSAALPSTPFLHVCSARLPPCRPHDPSCGHLTNPPCIAACTTPKRNAMLFSAARFTVSSSASRCSVSSDLRDFAAYGRAGARVPPLARTRRSRQGTGTRRASRGPGHLRTVRPAAPHVASSQARPALFSRHESNRANCPFHQCRS